jgi:hypothetical protein
MPLIGSMIDGMLGAVTLPPPSTVIACALVLDVRNWLWHLTMNTGELKKCERHHFTDWHWAQFEQAGFLPGPVQIPSQKLMECLNRLGYDIEIKVRPAAEPIGHLTLATV